MSSTTILHHSTQRACTPALRAARSVAPLRRPPASLPTPTTTTTTTFAQRGFAARGGDARADADVKQEPATTAGSMGSVEGPRVLWTWHRLPTSAPTNVPTPTSHAPEDAPLLKEGAPVPAANTAAWVSGVRVMRFGDAEPVLREQVANHGSGERENKRSVRSMANPWSIQMLRPSGTGIRVLNRSAGRPGLWESDAVKLNNFDIVEILAGVGGVTPGSLFEDADLPERFQGYLDFSRIREVLTRTTPTPGEKLLIELLDSGRAPDIWADREERVVSEETFRNFVNPTYHETNFMASWGKIANEFHAIMATAKQYGGGAIPAADLQRDGIMQRGFPAAAARSFFPSRCPGHVPAGTKQTMKLFPSAVRDFAHPERWRRMRRTSTGERELHGEDVATDLCKLTLFQGAVNIPDIVKEKVIAPVERLLTGIDRDPLATSGERNAQRDVCSASSRDWEMTLYVGDNYSRNDFERIDVRNEFERSALLCGESPEQNGHSHARADRVLPTGELIQRSNSLTNLPSEVVHTCLEWPLHEAVGKQMYFARRLGVEGELSPSEYAGMMQNVKTTTFPTRPRFPPTSKSDEGLHWGKNSAWKSEVFWTKDTTEWWKTLRPDAMSGGDYVVIVPLTVGCEIEIGEHGCGPRDLCPRQPEFAGELPADEHISAAERWRARHGREALHPPAGAEKRFSTGGSGCVNEETKLTGCVELNAGEVFVLPAAARWRLKPRAALRIQTEEHEAKARRKKRRASILAERDNYSLKMKAWREAQAEVERARVTLSRISKAKSELFRLLRGRKSRWERVEAASSGKEGLLTYCLELPDGEWKLTAEDLLQAIGEVEEEISNAPYGRHEVTARTIHRSGQSSEGWRDRDREFSKHGHGVPTDLLSRDLARHMLWRLHVLHAKFQKAVEACGGERDALRSEAVEDISSLSLEGLTHWNDPSSERTLYLLEAVADCMWRKETRRCWEAFYKERDVSLEDGIHGNAPIWPLKGGVEEAVAVVLRTVPWDSSSKKLTYRLGFPDTSLYYSDWQPDPASELEPAVRAVKEAILSEDGFGCNSGIWVSPHWAMDAMYESSWRFRELRRDLELRHELDASLAKLDRLADTFRRQSDDNFSCKKKQQRSFLDRKRGLYTPWSYDILPERRKLSFSRFLQEVMRDAGFGDDEFDLRLVEAVIDRAWMEQGLFVKQEDHVGWPLRPMHSIYSSLGRRDPSLRKIQWRSEEKGDMPAYTIGDGLYPFSAERKGVDGPVEK